MAHFFQFSPFNSSLERKFLKTIFNLCIYFSGQYQCLECAQAYLNPEHLRLHNLNEHSESRKIDGYQCLSCNEKFRYNFFQFAWTTWTFWSPTRNWHWKSWSLAIENAEEFIKQERDGTTTVTVVLKTDDVFADL